MPLERDRLVGNRGWSGTFTVADNAFEFADAGGLGRYGPYKPIAPSTRYVEVRMWFTNSPGSSWLGLRAPTLNVDGAFYNVGGTPRIELTTGGSVNMADLGGGSTSVGTIGHSAVGEANAVTIGIYWDTAGWEVYANRILLGRRQISWTPAAGYVRCCGQVATGRAVDYLELPDRPPLRRRRAL